MKPIRVLTGVSVRPASGGPGDWWLRMIPFLRARGVEVEVLTRRQPGRPPGLEIIDGITVHRALIADGNPTYWTRAKDLVMMVLALYRRRKRFDVVLFHSANFDAGYAGCLAGRVFGWKTIFKTTLLGYDDLNTIAKSGKVGRLRLASLKLADGLISMSRVLLHPYEDQPWLRSKLLLAPHGVDLKRFHAADPARKQLVRLQLGIPEDARVALFCGSVIYRKGVDLLVDAWQHVSRQVPNAVLLLVGPNHEDGLVEPKQRAFSEAIARRIQDLGLTRTVRLLGYQRQMDRYYAAADVFVFPSRSEGWPNVVGEAMASGLPCIVSSLYGVSEEQLQDGVEGFIVRSQTPQDYAERLVSLLADEETARRMGANARGRAEDHFDCERVADQYAAFFRRVAAGGGQLS